MVNFLELIRTRILPYPYRKSIEQATNITDVIMIVEMYP